MTAKKETDQMIDCCETQLAEISTLLKKYKGLNNQDDGGNLLEKENLLQELNDSRLIFDRYMQSLKNCGRQNQITG